MEVSEQAGDHHYLHQNSNVYPSKSETKNSSTGEYFPFLYFHFRNFPKTPTHTLTNNASHQYERLCFRFIKVANGENVRRM